MEAARFASTGRRRFLERIARGGVAALVLGFAAGIFRGFRGGGPPAACVRPPGALAEDEFLARCIRCMRCADACPNQCIFAFTRESGKDSSLAPGAGQYGTPVIFPRRQACILCHGAPGDTLLCTEACPTGALRVVRKERDSILAGARMGTAVVDRELCYSFQGSSCGVCVRACPLEGSALRAGMWETPLIDPERCVGCGLCERACVRYPTAMKVRPRNAAEAAS